MDFSAEQHLDAPIATVEAALVDPGFLETLDDLTTIGPPEVLDTTRHADTVVQRVRYRFIADLPAAVTAVVDPHKLTWVEEARYDLAEHTSTHAIVPDNYPDRLEAHYSCVLTTQSAGTIRTATGEVAVRMALVHGKVERVIVEGLRDFATEQAERLNRWLRDASGPRRP